MKDFFFKASTTSVVAVLMLLFGFGLLYVIVFTGHPKDDTTRVQIITGILALMGFPAQYFFGQAKNRAVPTTNVENANSVNTGAPAAKSSIGFQTPGTES